MNVGAANIIAISDKHVGCQLALCHPDGAALDNGGIYRPNRFQLAIWEVWSYFWHEWVPAAVEGEPFDLVVNGDSLDGVHHDSTTQWSHNLADQERHCVKIMQSLRAADGTYPWRNLYWIRGTEAHAGKSGANEERIAQAMNAVANEEGRYSRDELWLSINRGELSLPCHFLHHIGTTGSAQHEASAVNAELTAMFTDAGRWQRHPPAVVVRGHRHREIEVRVPCLWGQGIGFTTPGWQLKTPHAFRIAGARVTSPQIGGSLVRISRTGELYARHCVREIMQGAR